MKVADEYRTNPLSLKPGGSTVKVVFFDGKVYEYDKIKYPPTYVGKIEGKEGIVEVWVEDILVWTDNETKKYWEI